MGNLCSTPEWEKRKVNMDDLNSCEVLFLGGPGYVDTDDAENCPIDRLAFAHCGNSELSSHYPICPETFKVTVDGNEQMQDLYNEVILSLKNKKEKVEREFKRTLDPKAQYTGQKYHKDEALKQLDSVIFDLERLYKYRRPTESSDQEAPKLSDKELAVSGCENLPNLCLKLMLENPYAFDLMKRDVIKWEYEFGRMKYKPERYMGAAASMLSHLVRLGSAGKNRESIYFSGWLGQ